MQLWVTASTFAPMEKNCLWPPPKVSPLRRRAGKDPGGRLLVCMQSVSRQQLKTSLHQKADLLSNSISILSSKFSITLLCLHTLFLPPTLLCPSHPATWLVWQRYTKWRRGAESCKAESGSHFLTDPGPGTERVKIFYVKCTINITPWAFSVHVHQRLCLFLLFCLIYCTKKPLGPLGPSNGIKHHTQPLWFNLMQTQIMISLIKRKKKVDVDRRSYMPCI